MSATEFTRTLVREGIEHELIPHPYVGTARDEALEVGLAEVAKTIVVAGPNGFVRTILPAGERLDLHRLAQVLGTGRELRLASEEELADAYPMFELGAIPPFAGPCDRTVVDRRLAGRDWIVIDAGSHERSVRLRTRDVVRLAAAQIADICEH